MNLLNVLRACMTHIDQDMSARQLVIFGIIAEHKEPVPIGVREIFALLPHSKPAITRAVDRLENLRLVRRMVVPSDRRLVDVTLTPAGKKAWAAVNAA